MNIPGMPEMYDYESFPQKVRSTSGASPRRKAHKILDGSLCPSISCSEGRIQVCTFEFFGIIYSLTQQNSVIEGTEGLILTTSKLYENSGTLDALQAHRAAANKATFAIGPLLPLQYGSGNISNRGDDAVKSFMDAKLEKYGEKSVLFVSLLLNFIFGQARAITHSS